MLYGGDGKGATPIAVQPKALLKILHSESGQNTLISLKLAGSTYTLHLFGLADVISHDQAVRASGGRSYLQCALGLVNRAAPSK